MPTNKKKWIAKTLQGKFSKTLCKCFNNNFICYNNNLMVTTNRVDISWFWFFLIFFHFKSYIAVLCNCVVCVCVRVTKILKHCEPTGQRKNCTCARMTNKEDEKQTLEFISKRLLSFFHLITMLSRSVTVLSYSGWVRFWASETIKCVCMLIVVVNFLFLSSNKGQFTLI